MEDRTGGGLYLYSIDNELVTYINGTNECAVCKQQSQQSITEEYTNVEYINLDEEGDVQFQCDADYDDVGHATSSRAIAVNSGVTKNKNGEAVLH